MNNDILASARAEYVSGVYNLRELSEKYGLSLSKLKRESARGGWAGQRQENLKTLQEKAQHFYGGMLTGSYVKSLDREYRIAERISELLEKATAEQMEVIDVNGDGEQVSRVDIGALEKALKILKQVEEVKRFIGGFTTVHEDRQFMLNSEKLELERQRLNFGSAAEEVEEAEYCGVVILPEIVDQLSSKLLRSKSEE